MLFMQMQASMWCGADAAETFVNNENFIAYTSIYHPLTLRKLGFVTIYMIIIGKI